MMLKPIIATIAPWILSRIIKFFLDSKGEEKSAADFLFRDGGMPSNHTALVVGLSTTILLEQGISLLLLHSLVVMMIVAHDAMKLRKEAGHHAETLNKLMKKQKNYKPLNERLGHTFSEVAVAAIIGIITPIIIYMIDF